MARFNQFSFRGQLINGPNVRIGQITGQFGLPQLRGANWIAQGATGEIFVPKLHGAHDIILPLIVRDIPNGISQSIFDQIAIWAANRTQGDLANILDTGTRTAQAECTGWTQTDMTSAGLTFAGLATFHLADPWFYGPTVTATVTPTNTGTCGAVVTNDPPRTPRANFTLAIPSIASGQPIAVVAWGWEAVSTVTDSFGTPHSWSKLEECGPFGAADYFSLWVGTGGAGTSGTITVTLTSSGHCGGWAFPLGGSSTVDVHGQATGSGSVALSLTPATSAGEVAIVAGVDDNTSPGFLTSWPGAPWTLNRLITPNGNPFLGMGSAGAQTDATLSPLSATWSGHFASDAMAAVGVIMKTSGGAPVTLSVTNAGTATAEKLTLDFLGPIVNPAVVNATNGTSVSYTGAVAAGQHLIIDTWNETATNNGANVIGYVAHAGAVPLLTLAPGVNSLSVYGSGCTGATSLTVTFAPPWV